MTERGYIKNIILTIAFDVYTFNCDPDQVSQCHVQSL